MCKKKEKYYKFVFAYFLRSRIRKGYKELVKAVNLFYSTLSISTTYKQIDNFDFIKFCILKNLD